MLDDVICNFSTELAHSDYTILKTATNIRYNTYTQRIQMRFRLFFTVLYFDQPAFFKDCPTIVSSLRQSMHFFRRNEHHSQEAAKKMH